ncbi:MAG: ABC transporter ATP-binding protein [Micrococcales bacterium]|nr:ABC transporter ATP-binding protein [Micrococcales bacterium]
MSAAIAALEAVDIVVERGGHLILNNLNCTVPVGSVSVIVGPNGAGKSTLLHSFASIITPNQGDLLLNGSSLDKVTRRHRAQKIAWVEQMAEAEIDLTVAQVVLLGRTPQMAPLSAPSRADLEMAERSMQTTGTESLANRDYASLSGGEKQRVLLARALAQEPEVLLLDEPLNHLDLQAAFEVLSLIRTLAVSGITVLAAIHDLDRAIGVADHLLVMSQGQVVASGPPAILDAQLVEQVFAVQADFVAHPRQNRPLVVISQLE